MQHDIPQDQLDKIQPLVDRILTAFRKAELDMPVTTESALSYSLEHEPRDPQ